MQPAPFKAASTPRVFYLQVDMCDAFTWSFPEFIPFCASLYYYSSLKTFGNSSAAL